MKNFYCSLLLFLPFLLHTSTSAQQNVWQDIGPSGVSITSMSISPSGADTIIYAGTSGSGVYLSTNNGSSWTQVNNGLTNTNIQSLAISPNGAGGTNIFAGTNGSGLFRSTNSGSTWTQVKDGLTDTVISALAVIGTNVFAGALGTLTSEGYSWISLGGGVYLSTDQGLSWTNVNNELSNTLILYLVTSGSNLIVGTNGLPYSNFGTRTPNLFISTNNGSRWDSVAEAPPKVPTALAANGSNICTNYDSGWFPETLLSTDNGLSWKIINHTIPEEASALALNNNISGGIDIYKANGVVYLSTDSCQSWTQFGNGLSGGSIKILSIFGSHIYAGTSNGIWKCSLNNSSSIQLSAPNGGENWYVGTTQNITWTSTNISNVKLEYSTDNGQSWLLITPSTPASTGSYSWIIPDNPSTTCKVRISNVTDTSIFNVSANSFTMLESAGTAPTPILAYPTDGVTVYTNSPSLNWYISTYSPGIKYNLQVSTSSDFSNILFDIDNINGLNYQLSNLTTGTTYYTRVRSKTPAGDYSSFSATGSFNVYGSFALGLAVPLLCYPNNGVAVYTNSPIIGWYINMAAPPLTYHLQVSLTSDFASPFVDVDNIDSISYLLTGLTGGTTYYTRVQSKTAEGLYSIYSTTGSFVVSPEVAYYAEIPTMSSPVKGTTVFSISPALIWSVNNSKTTLKYNIQLSSSPDFSNILLDVDNLNSPTYQVDSSTFGTNYYARVRSKTSNGIYSRFSGIGTFTIYANNSPVVPMLGNPINEVTINSDQAVLSWYLNTYSKPLKYDLQYSTTNDFTNATTISNLDSNSFAIKNLSINNEYNWRVRSKTDNGASSAYSSVGKFIVSSTTNVGQTLNNKTVPASFELKQNYPNPFNPTTTIIYTIPKATFISLRVYDILGNIVTTLVNENKQAGNYSIEFNPKNISSGVYFYRLQAGSFVETKKLVFLK
jgi:hypothetical protein